MGYRLNMAHLTMLCIVLSGCSDGQSIAETNDAEAPNFLFIISDDQGLDASAQYAVSQDVPHTPVIDSLAAKGIVFDNAWATPSCTTTRGSIISGQHGINSGVTTTPALMDPNTLTLQRYLKSHTAFTYSTAVIGKWHLAGGNATDQLSHPNDVGVDYYAGNISGTVDSFFDWPLNINGNLTSETSYHTSKITDLAIDWIQQQVSPWFMWLAYVSPHSPFHLPPAHLHTQTLSGDTNNIQSNPRAYYLAAIEAMDTEIGRLLDSIPQNERDNTLIVFLGDNGTPRRVIDTNVYELTHGKGSLYEGGIRVPMVVSGKGVSRVNEREAALVNTTDLFATVSQAAGMAVPSDRDSQSFLDLLSSANSSTRAYNYSEYVSSTTHGWAVRNANFKLMVNADGTKALFNLTDDPRELVNLIEQTDLYAELIAALETYGNTIRFVDQTDNANAVIDITNANLVNQTRSCAAYVNDYKSNALDVATSENYKGDLKITVLDEQCVFTTNAIPNHNLNDGAQSFPNSIAEQFDEYRIPLSPQRAADTTPLSLSVDNAIMLNGVKVDILAAGCFGVGNGKIGCDDISQPWRYDPLFSASGFRVDSHNAHTQPDGTYHYHGAPNALFSATEVVESPVVGFAADGFPIFGSYFIDNGTVRKVRSSYRLKSGERPSGSGQPGGVYDGTFRDDYEFIAGAGDLDACNGMVVEGSYRYYITDEFPYVLGCFSGTPDDSFYKH